MIIAEQIAHDILRMMQDTPEAEVETALDELWRKYELQGVNRETFCTAVEQTGRRLCEQGEQQMAEGHALKQLATKTRT
jgi:hypothetical protein